MRFFLAAAVCLTFIGGLTLYMNQRAVTVANAPLPPVAAPTAATARFALEITPAFTVEPDPFAIRLDDAEAPPALVVRLGKQEIFKETERLEAGKPLRIEPLEGLVIGDNEFYVEANPPVETSDQSQALRLRLFRNDQPEAEKTFWSEPGGKAAGVFRFTLQDDKKEAEHGGH